MAIEAEPVVDEASEPPLTAAERRAVRRLRAQQVEEDRRAALRVQASSLQSSIRSEARSRWPDGRGGVDSASSQYRSWIATQDARVSALLEGRADG